MIGTLSKPIQDFIRCAECLLSDPITPQSFTNDEVELLKAYLQELTERFFRT